MWIDVFYRKGINDRFYLFTNVGFYGRHPVRRMLFVCVPCGLRVNDKTREMKGTYFIWGLIYGVMLVWIK